MFNEDIPRTKEEARAYRYNTWGGLPEGRPYDETRCAYEVHEQGRGCLFYQCLRKKGNGPDGLFCKQHAKMIK